MSHSLNMQLARAFVELCESQGGMPAICAAPSGIDCPLASLPNPLDGGARLIGLSSSMVRDLAWTESGLSFSARVSGQALRLELGAAQVLFAVDLRGGAVLRFAERAQSIHEAPCQDRAPAKPSLRLVVSR